MDQEKITALFETYIRKLRITPAWDVRLEFVENKEFSYGRCSKQKSFHELYDGLKNID